MTNIDDLILKHKAVLQSLEEDVDSRLAWNEKLWEFCNSLAEETLLMGPNQTGKTVGLLRQINYTMTGEYPRGYDGHRFRQPVHIVICGETALSVRDTLTDRLLGHSDNRGSGIIRKENLDPDKIIPGGGEVRNQIDHFFTRHRTDGMEDGWSRCTVISYKSGERRIAGYPLNAAFLDEEPKYEIYDELSARLNYTGGPLYNTMCPLWGWTPYLKQFRDDRSGFRRLIHYDIDDATHMTEEQRMHLKRKYENHPLAAARLHGQPVEGAGQVFPIPNEDLQIAPFTIPSLWPQIIGLDFPHTTGSFAAAKLALDRDNDTVYLAGVYKDHGKDAPSYADRVRKMGGNQIVCVWPHDAARKLEGGGTIAKRYKDLGLNMHNRASTIIGIDGKATTSTWAAIEDVIDRMVDGRFRVFDHCIEWFQEKNDYRHEGGAIVKGQEDHLIDATLKAMMMLRHARPVNRKKKDFRKMRGRREYDFFSGGRGMRHA